ncbi:MAG: stage V sporulation protein AB [Eubacteriales bacterium]
MGTFLSILAVFAGGVIVGSSLAAFYLALNIFLILSPEIKGSYKFYAAASVLGTILASIIYFSDMSLNLSPLLAIIPGLAFGAFTGILIACITEMLNVIRLLDESEMGKLGVVIIIISVMAGKLAGSLVFWIGNLFR